MLELAGKRQIRYVDPRQFGLIVARPGHDIDAMPEFADYGPEPLSEDFTPEYLKQAFSRRSVDLEVALMNQQVIVGHRQDLRGRDPLPRRNPPDATRRTPSPAPCDTASGR